MGSSGFRQVRRVNEMNPARPSEQLYGAQFSFLRKCSEVVKLRTADNPRQPHHPPHFKKSSYGGLFLVCLNFKVGWGK